MLKTEQNGKGLVLKGKKSQTKKGGSLRRRDSRNINSTLSVNLKRKISWEVEGHTKEEKE